MSISTCDVARITKPAIVLGAVLMLSACFSLSNVNPFADKKQDSTATTNTDDTTQLSEQEQSRRDALVKGKSSRPSLKSLALTPVSMNEIAVPILSLIEKREQYEALIPLISDPTQKRQAAFRLADIKMLIAEQGQEEGASLAAGSTSFAEAIHDYQKVLNDHAIVQPLPNVALSSEQQALNRKQMDAMYQLTRALDLSAQADESMAVAKQFLATFNTEQFTVTPYHLELYFRIGEYYFNRQQYPQAVNYYSQVVSYGNGGTKSKTNFYAISAYMLGWSHFKLDDYALAMNAFATMLDASLIQNNDISVSDLETLPVNKFPVTKGDLRLVQDAVRVMALTFSYQGNGDAIQTFFKDFGSRDYEQLIYDELAQQHLDNDRFQDSANVLVSFANQKPLHPRAIEFYIRHIDAYVLGGFPTRVLIAKENFVSTYSLGNGVVESLDTPIGRNAIPYLKQYITELAQTEHSIAQGIDDILLNRAATNTSDDLAASQNSGFTAQNISYEQNSAWTLASNEDLQTLSQQAYSKAKRHYQNYIRTFSPSPEVAPLRFYLAEALLALNEFDAAIEAFETFAYVDYINADEVDGPLVEQNFDMPKPVDAAYAALLVYQKIAQQNIVQTDVTSTSISTMPFQAPLGQHQQSQAKFALTFVTDERTPVVALTLMQGLFAEENYLPAQQWATWLLEQSASNTLISASMNESAHLVMAHSYFAMDIFDKAERGYRGLLLTMPATDERHQGLTDRLAASLYKQAENILLSQKIDTTSLQTQNITTKSQLTPTQLAALIKGLSFLQKVVADTPLSEFRMAAQYDSAVYFALLEQWPESISTFTDFQTRYPQSPLTQGIESQLFYAYEQTENWPKAAQILMTKYNAQPTSDIGRLALFQAAQYYEKAGDRAQSLENFRTYAHAFPTPLADANEARFNLTEYYLQSREDRKRRFWLNKLVQAQQGAMQQNPVASTSRSVYLGSFAAMVFANDADIAYTRIKLTQPLNESLQSKQAALKKAIVEYERVISFGSAQYVTAANFKLASLYTTLAQDLMDSSRPNDLSALELSQYEILLEEQAYPFEDTAINLHEKNIARVSSGLYDDWVKESFTALKRFMPARYNKPEVSTEVTVDDL